MLSLHKKVNSENVVLQKCLQSEREIIPFQENTSNNRHEFYQRKEHYAEKSVLSLKIFLLYLNIEILLIQTLIRNFQLLVS